MCSGLIKGVAKRSDNHEWIKASDATKELSTYYCDECNSDAIVRKCVEKRDHFAHRAESSNLFSPSETALHKSCKNEICESLKTLYPNGKFECERHFEADEKKELGKVVPDISGRTTDGIGVIIEAQRSLLNIRTIIRRTLEYKKRGGYILWVVPLKSPLPKYFRPRLFERFLHAMYMGRVYYWQQGYGSTVDAVHFAKTAREIPTTSFYKEGGELAEFGGFNKVFRTIRKPESGGRLNIGQDFIKKSLEYFPVNYKGKNTKDIPERNLLMDNKDKWWDDSIYNVSDDYQDLINSINKLPEVEEV